MAAIPFTFESPWGLAMALVVALAAVTLAARRRVAVHRVTAALACVAMALFALAAGGLTWRRAASTEVVVMVDCSPSTRGAAYRERAELDRRVKQLLGDTPYRIIYFADRNSDQAAAGALLADLSAERTEYAPPAAVAVVLFSDGRFELPASAPPTFVVADPKLDGGGGDAAVTRLEARGRRVAVGLSNAGDARQLTLDAAATQPSAVVEGGSVTLTRDVRAGADVATAQLNKGDRWPENDALSLPLAPPMRSQRWFVSAGGAAPGAGWTLLRPADLARKSAADFLAPGVIVLDNLAAADVSERQRELEQYVRDLGGALVIAGGDRAFAAGGYTGTAIEAMSPLASAPPAPAVHWMLLADSSGSMSAAVGPAATQWQMAAGAIARLLPALPPEDPVSIGSFAADVRWWTTGKSARETAAMTLPPAGVGPGGPTNLQAALERIAAESTGAMATELVVVSDADTTIDRPAELAARLKAKKIRLHVLAIGEKGAQQALPALEQMTAATNGMLRQQFDPKEWAATVQGIFKDVAPVRFFNTSIAAKFAGDLAALPGRRVSPWDRTWLKKSAAELAGANDGAEAVPLCARWAVGGGEVIACAFGPAPAELEAMARLIARPPRDPKYVVTWDAGPRLTVRVDAADRGKYLNDERLRLEVAAEDDSVRPAVHDVPQVGPGRYELALAAPRVRSFAALRLGERLIDRVAVPQRYAPEFDAIGNDYDAMRALAGRTGGRVIDRSWVKPIEFTFPRRELDLTAWLALAGGGMLAAGLARWRVG